MQIVVTDLRTISFDVPPQEILTKDSVTVAVDAVVYYKIQNPMAAVCNVSDYSKSTRLLASTTLRTILGTRNLSEILSDREHIASAILGQLDSATDPWGIKVKLKKNRIAIFGVSCLEFMIFLIGGTRGGEGRAFAPTVATCYGRRG